MNIFRNIRRGYVISSIVLVVIGLIVVLFPSLSENIFSNAIGGCLVFYGAIRMTGYFVHHMHSIAYRLDLSVGVIFAIMGIILVFFSNKMIFIRNVILGTSILIDGAARIQTAFDTKWFGLSKWWLVLMSAMACIGCGITLIVISQEDIRLLMTVSGISLMIDGMQNLLNALVTAKIGVKGENEV